MSSDECYVIDKERDKTKTRCDECKKEEESENGEDDKESREDEWVMKKRVFDRGIKVKNCDKHEKTNNVGDRANKKEGYEEYKGHLLWKEVTIEG